MKQKLMDAPYGTYFNLLVLFQKEVNKENIFILRPPPPKKKLFFKDLFVCTATKNILWLLTTIFCISRYSKPTEIKHFMFMKIWKPKEMLQKSDEDHRQQRMTRTVTQGTKFSSSIHANSSILETEVSTTTHARALARALAHT